MCEYFLLNRKSFNKEILLKAIVKLKYDFIFIKTKLTQNIFTLVCANFSRTVYSCSGCYKISQFVFSTYSRMYLKSVLSLV